MKSWQEFSENSSTYTVAVADVTLGSGSDVLMYEYKIYLLESINC